ncbi:MAG: hypothetical protein F6K50_29895 [Moorea sp. SIO3I7]|uniref:hypothetical protein n=1 Tax=unclassified Moorena TaxID=2683338 RepID=UPI0013C07B4E|nr:MULTISPECIES: hypothetical protein [unclassified Moorena]NEN99540.1 hypothetical protein [Moorena sp. SIO3I7]NEO06635.1 hypothetical protein [Moorena sp. SIO3I8]NEP21838.1 hypothetical protein [Moorena sp. SIO3I6]
MSTIIATTITITPADVGWAVQQSNQYSSRSHSKALPTNWPPQHILKLARCQFHQLSRCRVGSAADQSAQLPIP